MRKSILSVAAGVVVLCVAVFASYEVFAKPEPRPDPPKKENPCKAKGIGCGYFDSDKVEVWFPNGGHGS